MNYTYDLNVEVEETVKKKLKKEKRKKFLKVWQHFTCEDTKIVEETCHGQ